MSIFVMVLCVGLGGLLFMALPGVRRHGHAGHARARGRAVRSAVRGQGRGRGALHGNVRGHAGRGAPRHPGGQSAKGAAAPQHGAHPHELPELLQQPRHGLADGLLRYMPEPRLIFSLLALFGAFGNVLQHALHLSLWTSALGAAVIAVLLEWLVVGRLWRVALRFTGEPTSPLDSLVMDRAEAVTPFRNGKGIVRAVIDGRAIQLSAELVTEDSGQPVRVGDRVTIQEVDSDHERVRVSVR